VLQDDPYFSFDAWYPKGMSRRGGAWSVDDDRPSTYEVTLDAPAEFRFATTGTLVADPSEKDGRVVRELRAEGVRGFTFYGKTDWTVHPGEARGVRIRCFVPEQHDEWGPRLLESVKDAVDFHVDRLGSYPTEHLDLIAIHAEQGGGAFACANVIGIFLGRGVEERYRWLVAHEVAHQYFGNRVNQARNEVYWVIVGLGMVVDRDYMIDRGLGDKMHRQMVGMVRMVKDQGRDTTLTQPMSELLSADPPWAYQWNLALGHAKAYAVCSMLEELTGKEKFEAVLRDLVQAEGGGMITHADLVERCEKAGAGDLDWFVADWIEGDATLDHAVTRVERKGGVWEVEVERIGEAAYPRTVEAETASGKKLRRRLDRTKETQVLRFETDEELVVVTLDPDGIYPDMDPGNDRWTR
jgi:aminopeptidase N